jgi:predicted small secreted protein
MKLIILSFTAIFALASCNTMVGLGRDTRLLGEGLEKTAEKSAPTAESTSGAPVY